MFTLIKVESKSLHPPSLKAQIWVLGDAIWQRMGTKLFAQELMNIQYYLRESRRSVIGKPEPNYKDFRRSILRKRH